MKEICPICIITAQSESEFDVFKAKIDRQFNAFASQEFDKDFDVNKHKWWTIFNVVDIGKDEFNGDFLQKADLPILNSSVGLYNAKRFVFIFVGSDNYFDNLIKFVVKIKEFQSAGRILGGIADVFYYGICYFNHQNFKKQKLSQIAPHAATFDVLVFQSTINFHPVKNPKGYHDLNKVNNSKEVVPDTEKVLDSLVQLIFHAGLTINVLYQSKELSSKVLMTAGAYSLTYEPEFHKHTVAAALLYQMFPEFCIDETPKLWSDEYIANQYISSADLVSKWGWNATYKFFVTGYETKEESENRNREIIKLLYKPTVSAWSLFSQWLIPVYFKKYIKSLAVNLRESAHSFMYSINVGYSNHLNKKFEDVIDGSSDVAIAAVGKLLKNVWAENNSLENPVGLQHILLVLEKVKTFIDGQVIIIDGLKNENAPTGTSFPSIDDYPLKNIPNPLLAFYKDFMQHGEEKQETDSNTDENKSYEQTTLTKLIKLLQFHPVPLSIFIRAAILGIILPLVIFAGLLLIPDKLINTSYFETGHGTKILFIVIFASCLLMAFYKYWFGILRKIKIIIQKYLAWIFWKTQQKLFKDTLNQQIKYYQALLAECSRIKQNITEGFIPTSKLTDSKADHSVFENLKSTLFPEAEPKFEQGMFQRDILGKFDNEWSILNDDRVNIQVHFNKTKYSYSSLSDENKKALLFRSLFIEPGINTVPIYQYLFNKVIEYQDEQGPAANFDEIRQEFCIMLIAELKTRISLENAESIQELIFRNAPLNQGHNFNMNSNTIYINKLIQSRYYPSVLLKNTNPYSQVSYIVPEDQLCSDEDWAKVFGNTRKPDHLIHRKSLVSIMQTFSLNGLPDIFDEDNKNNQTQQ